MPPVNTPQRSPTRPHTPSQPNQHTRPLTPLSYLSSPAPDLASTLHTSQAADQADEANVTFLRNSLDSLDQASQQSRRFYVDATRDPRRPEYRTERGPALSQSQRETPEDLSRRERLQRVLARLNRLHDPATSTSSTAAYTNRTPSPNRQSLYDWAPSYDENNQEDNELDAILSELRRQQPETHPDILRVLSQSQLDSSRQGERDSPSAMANELADMDQRRRMVVRDGESRRRDNEWASLRSRAVLHRARQEVGGSPSGTERMLRYVMDRERSGMSEEEERARGTGWFRPSPTRSGTEQQHRSAGSSRESWTLPPPSGELRDRDRQERVEAFRRGYLAENVPPRLPRISTPPVPTHQTSQPNPSFLENALKYLSELRSCRRYEEALSTAIDHGLATKEFFADKHDDFVMDLEELPNVPWCSWLQPGTILEGHQHANTPALTHTQQRQRSASRVEQINPTYRASNATTTGFDHPPGSTRVVSFDANRTALTYQPVPTNVRNEKESHHDSWPVRVIIHSIDSEKMTIQGTMEAYDVPQHPSSLSIVNSADRPKAGKKHAPITTYLEGHIIDMRTHSFLTPGNPEDKTPTPRSNATSNTDTITFPAAGSHIDAQNWLKLPPFSSLVSTTNSQSTSPQDALARFLLSEAYYEKLHTEYIFMRWKEKCFIHSKNDECSSPQDVRAGDQDRGHGLTISGFYYVSLRRSDGWVEGLYFDPLSSPYQCLRLKGRTGGWGVWGFR